MAMGRKPKPTHLKLVTGNPGHRPLNQAEPVAPRAIPKPPKYLSKNGKREWRRLAPLLFDAGLIANLDQLSFARLCQLQARVAEGEEKLAAADWTTTSSSGYQMPNPLFAIINTASKQLVALCTEFGLTPSSRSRIRVDNAKPKDDFEDYLKHAPGQAPG